MMNDDECDPVTCQCHTAVIPSNNHYVMLHHSSFIIHLLRTLRHETTRCGHRHRLRHAPGHRDRNDLAAAAGRRVGRRLHHALRRQQLPHQDLRRSPQLGPLRRRRKSRGLEVPGPAHPLRRRRRQEGHGRLRPGHLATRSHPLRRLHRQRRRPAGFPPLHADDGRRPVAAATSSIWPGSPATAWKRCTPSPNWSKNRTCPPATWPASSTPKGRTSTA